MSYFSRFSSSSNFKTKYLKLGSYFIKAEREIGEENKLFLRVKGIIKVNHAPSVTSVNSQGCLDVESQRRWGFPLLWKAGGKPSVPYCNACLLCRSLLTCLCIHSFIPLHCIEHQPAARHQRHNSKPDRLTPSSTKDADNHTRCNCAVRSMLTCPRIDRK